ncbi:MAG: DUF58 domain-containing protein [Chloroflexi bacterium]|nr:DUF58 domain-containing protein [Chloroflexota bacterium]
MMILRRPILQVTLRTYGAIVLVVATALSPLALSFLPILILLWYLYLWRWKTTPVIHLLTDYFLFFAASLMLAKPAGTFLSLLIAVPILLLVTTRLEDTAATLKHRAGQYSRRPTAVAITLAIIAVFLLTISLMFGSLPLTLGSLAAMAYVAMLMVVAWRGLATRPVEVVPAQQRMVAGTEAQLNIALGVKTRVGGLLFLESPYEWLKVSPDVLPLKADNLKTKVSLSPELSGPSTIKLRGYAIDRWGLVQTGFEIEAIQLYVVPRARYATWLVERYMATSRAGNLPLVSNVGTIKPLHGLRRGVEYYGSQLYQPGDSLKNIDWKHSLQYDKLITKEFAEFQGMSAVVLVNLVVCDATEADKLAYKLLTTSLSLAQETIPAALAVYNHEEVVLTTAVLPPSRLLLTSLQVARKIVIVGKPTRYLSPPDMARLWANIRRLKSVQSQPAEALTQLLKVEWANLSRQSVLNPVTKALAQVFAKVDRQSNVVIVSQHNHDTEALEFSTFSLRQKGNCVLAIEDR